MKTDYYQILELDKNCSLTDIKNSYRRLALKYHPDRHPNHKKEYENKFKEINEAYQILSNTRKRQEYDNNYHNSNFNDMLNPFDIFNQFFNHQSIFNMDSRINEPFFNLYNDYLETDFIHNNNDNVNNYYQKSQTTKYINGKMTKETKIRNNNIESIIYEINGKKTKEIKTNLNTGETQTFIYDTNGKLIRN